MDLRGKVAIVTGGGRGIGRSIARALAKNGADVVVSSRTSKEIESVRDEIVRDFKVRSLAIPCDVAKEKDVEALVAKTKSELGRVDILVNNAGINGAIGELETCDLAEWRSAIEVNLFGTVYTTRAVVPIMRAQGGGKIVNLAGGGVGGPGVAPRVSAYTTSKGAVVQFTESIAREIGEHNIQINAIAPGAVVTEMTAAVVAAGPEKAGKELYERTLKQRESGGESPDLAANFIAWLVSDASGKVTGKFFSAKWDKPEKIVAAASDPSLYALRRIDNDLFQGAPK